MVRSLVRILVKPLILLAALASPIACTSTSKAPPGTKRVETWGTKTTWVDGKKTTVKSHEVDHVKIPEKGPEWAFKGNWHIEDYTDTKSGDRSCYIELFPAKLGQYNFQLKVTNRCHAEMQNVRAWRPVGNPVGTALVLVDKNGNAIGQFDQRGKSLFRGTFVLTNGNVVRAHLKRW